MVSHPQGLDSAGVLQVRITRAPIQGLKFKSAPGYHSHHLKPQFKKNHLRHFGTNRLGR